MLGRLPVPQIYSRRCWPHVVSMSDFYFLSIYIQGAAGVTTKLFLWTTLINIIIIGSVILLVALELGLLMQSLITLLHQQGILVRIYIASNPNFRPLIATQSVLRTPGPQVQVVVIPIFRSSACRG